MMQWYNEPVSWHESDGKITVITNPETDFWRKTRHDFIADNGHFYYQTIQGNFSAQVKITGEYKDLYDQAGLMIRLNEQHWIKCGIEFVKDIQYASAVVTHDFSDWSVNALPQNPESVWFRLSHFGSAVEIDFSLDGTEYHMIRQAYFIKSPTVEIGLMCASPKGTGFATRFENFKIQTL